MSYYDALTAKWATLSGTTAAKLAAVNAATTAGPNIDVKVAGVVGVLMLSGAYLTLASFSQSATSGDPTHDTALGAAKLFMAMVTLPNAPNFNTSDPTNYAKIKGLADAIMAQETAATGSTGFTQAVHDAVLALAVSQVPWISANGYPVLSMNDVTAAGLN